MATNSEKALRDEAEKLREEMEKLRKENSELKKQRVGLTFKIADRNRVGIVFGTYTCSLFKSQWMKILEHQDEVKAFIQKNDEKLD